MITLLILFTCPISYLIVFLLLIYFIIFQTFTLIEDLVDPEILTMELGQIKCNCATRRQRNAQLCTVHFQYLKPIVNGIMKSNVSQHIQGWVSNFFSLKESIVTRPTRSTVYYPSCLAFHEFRILGQLLLLTTLFRFQKTLVSSPFKSNLFLQGKFCDAKVCFKILDSGKL